MSEQQRFRISLYLDLAKYPELEYLQTMGAGRSAEALRLLAIGKRHEDYVVKQMSERLGGITSPEALREILFNPSSSLHGESLGASPDVSLVEKTPAIIQEEQQEIIKTAEPEARSTEVVTSPASTKSSIDKSFLPPSPPTKKKVNQEAAADNGILSNFIV